MKINKKALRLIDKGLSANTVSKLDESQVDVLYKKLFVEQINVSKTDTEMITKLKSEKKPFQVYEKELEEEEEVTVDPNKETETQDPKQVGPSSDDGFGDETDGMGIMEAKKKKKKVNPWAICTAQLGKKFKTTERHLWNTKQKNKYERCVKDVKQSLKEGKNPVSLILESKIMTIVEKNIPARITKGDLLKFLQEDTKTAPAKPKTSPKTKPDEKPKTRPKHPGKNPNPGENPSPKAVSPEKAKDEVLDLIMKLLEM
jgi:hypothetical protein